MAILGGIRIIMIIMVRITKGMIFTIITKSMTVMIKMKITRLINAMIIVMDIEILKY